MKVAVIGGGPSGMMASFVGGKNHEVTLFEKNEKLGKKLYITGKGRCNLTNYLEASEFFPNIVRNAKFAYSAIYSFDPFMTIDLFESYGLKLKVERGNRVFPKSDKASDVIKTYEKMLKDRNIEIKLNTEVFSLEKNEDFIINKKFHFDKIVLATGGLSYRETGSMGDGYKFAKNFSHEIIETLPALCGVESENPLDLAGLSLKNVEVSAYEGEKLIAKEFGEMIFTHKGVSGPIILSLSSKINRRKNLKLFLDLKPALDHNKLDARLLRDFENNPNKEIKNVLINLLPKDLIKYILEASKISEDKKINQISKEDRENLRNSLKSFDLKFKNLEDINRAIVTSGGISTKEIDPHTMESKKVKGLYFAGEIIDIDALTGGFNIQLANATGYLAGLNL